MKTRAKQKSNLEQTQKKIEVTKSKLANWTLPWWSQNLVNRCITAGKAFKDHLLTTSFLEGRGQFGVKGSLDWERMNHLRLQVWLTQWTTAPTVSIKQKLFKKVFPFKQNLVFNKYSFTFSLFLFSNGINCNNRRLPQLYIIVKDKIRPLSVPLWEG